MRSTATPAQLLQLLLAILIMSSSGTLGRYILLPPEPVIWLRCLIGAIVLWVILKLMGKSLKIEGRRNRNIVLLSTLLLGTHWVTYFHTLKLTTVAIGMLSLFIYPTITAVLEPLILKTKFDPRHLVLALLALFGVYLLVPDFELTDDYTIGVLIGIFSATAYAIRNILLKKGVDNTDGTVLMFYQLLGNTLLIWPLVLFVEFEVPEDLILNWDGLLILGAVTTATGHTLFVRSFKHFNITAVSIISNLTPIFGIILGFMVLGEIPEGNVMLGGAIILSTTFIEAFYSMRKRQQS